MIGVPVVLAALFYAALGLVALIRPGQILLGFGIEANGTDARNEIRAVYGGFPLALAAALVIGLYVPTWRSGILVCAALSTGGMTTGRAISAIIDRRIGRLPLLFLGIELVIAALIALPLAVGG